MFFFPPQIFCAFIDRKRNMFRDRAQEDASDIVLIDINSDVFMGEGNFRKNRLEDEI